MKVILYSGSRLIEGADVVLRNRLYVSGWCICSYLRRMKQRLKLELASDITHIAVCFEGDVPVAVALNTGSLVMAFCRKDRRRSGFASAAVKALPAFCYDHATVGIDCSARFWDKNQVKTR